MRLVYFKFITTLLFLLSCVSLQGQENISMRIKRYKSGNYVKLISGDYFNILDERIDVVESDELSFKKAKELLPSGYIDSIPYQLRYKYHVTPVNAKLRMKDLDGLYTVEYYGTCLLINYFIGDKFHHYKFKRIANTWEVQEIQSFKMKEVYSGRISLYEYLNPKQINAKIQTLLLYGYTISGAKKKIEREMTNQKPVIIVHLVGIDRFNHVLLTAHPITKNSTSYTADPDSIPRWEVTRGIQHLPQTDSMIQH